MSKVTTAVKKKGSKKKKLGKITSPDILDNVLLEDIDLNSDLNLSNLEYDHFKNPNTDVLSSKTNRDEPMFPHELHMALKNQIQGLEEEKEDLKSKLRQAEEKLTIASPLRNLGRSSDLAANRIVELGKKVRELQAQIKQQNQAQKKLMQHNSEESGDASYNQTEDVDTDNGVCCGQAKAQLEEISDKFNTANSKLCELRNQNQQLKHEHKLAIKALSSELGEKVNVMNILSGGQGWRGRAQQILTLQLKVNELTEKLSAAQGKLDISDNSTGKERGKIDALKAEVETIRTEGETLKTELTETKKRLEESRARTKSLQTELSALRQANSVMSEKIAGEKKIIDNLNTHLLSVNEKAKGKESIINNKFEHQINVLKKDLSQEKHKNEQLQDIIKERDSKISLLQSKVSVFNQSCNQIDYDSPESRSNSRVARSASLDREVSQYNQSGSSGEAERVRLMELVGVNSRRLQEERKNSTVLEEQLRSERHRCVRLETKLARLELERIGWAKGLYKKPPSAEPSNRSDSDWDSLKDKMELLEEKCLTLESRVKTLQQEKDEDSRRFIQIIEEQRASFQELQRKSNPS